MKKIFTVSMMFVAAFLIGCNSLNKSTEATHDHGVEAVHDHDHEGHNHETEEAHDHNHEGHNHEAEEAHDHNHEGHNHEAEEAHDHSSHSHTHAETAHSHSHAEGESHSTDEITFSPEQAAAAGLQTEVVKAAPFGGVIRTSGRILSATGDERVIVAPTNGVVTLGGNDILPGKHLSSGQAFASISAREMADGDPYVKVRAAYETALKEYERDQALVKDQIISAKEFEQSRLEYETAKAAYDAYAGRSGDKGLSLTSPMNGYIKQLMVSNGDHVSVGQPVAVVSQNSKLQLRAEVGEKYFSRIAGIRSANFQPAYGKTVYSLSQLGGRLLSYGRSSDEGSYFLPVLFEFNNTGSFVPGSFAEIWLLEAERPNVISIPTSALTEEQSVYYVYLKLDEECYKKQEVQIGTDNGLRTEILGGLNEGDEVVTRGVYQVKLASVSGAIPEGHTHNH